MVDSGSKRWQEISREEAALSNTIYLVFINTEPPEEVFSAGECHPCVSELAFRKNYIKGMLDWLDKFTKKGVLIVCQLALVSTRFRSP